MSLECPWSRPESLGPLYYNGFKRISVSRDCKIPVLFSCGKFCKFQVDVNKMASLCAESLIFTSFLKGAGARAKFGAIQDDVKNAQFPGLKLDTFPVPLEARIELWLKREAYSKFSVRRLEISQIYHLRTLSRPCKVLRSLFLSVWRG